jgi:hypothetical protein
LIETDMKDLLPLLRKRRTAKRDAALGRVATARGQRDAAQAALDKTAVSLRESLGWLAAVRQGQGLGADVQWNQAMRASCDALVERAYAALSKAEQGLKQTQQVLAQRQRELMVCERALMRTDELEALEKLADEEIERLREQDLDDDLAAGWKAPASAQYSGGQKGSTS